MLRLGYLSLVVAAISLCVPLFFPKPAHACSCAVETRITQQERTERAFSQASAVFAGEVTDVQDPPSPVINSMEPVTVTFDVSKTWKGSRTGTLEVTTPNSSAGCGYDFRNGEEYLVYAPKDMEVWLCGETKLLSEAAPDLEALGSPEALPNTSGIVASAPGSRVAPLLAGLTLAVLTLGFVYVA